MRDLVGAVLIAGEEDIPGTILVLHEANPPYPFNSPHLTRIILGSTG